MSEVPVFHHPSIDNTHLLVLPVAPAVLAAVLAAVSADPVDLRRLAGIIGRDAALSARVLGVANSTADPGRTPQPANLEATLAALGLPTLRTIATTAAVYQTFSGSHGIPRDELDRFQRHTLTCAHLARNLAKTLAYPAPDEAYLAGLLHDLGRLIIAARHPTALQEVRVLSQDAGDIPALEQRLFGVDHCDLGAALVESWRLRSFLADAIRFHHQPTEALRGAHPLLRLLHVANLLNQDDAPGDAAFSAADRLFGLAPARLRELCAESAREVEGVVADCGIARPAASDRPTVPPASVNGEMEPTVRNLLLVDGIGAELHEADDEPALLAAIARSATMLFGLTEIHFFPHDPQTGMLQGTDPGWPGEIVVDPDGARNSLSRALLDRCLCHSLGDGGTDAGVIDRQLARGWQRDGILCLPFLAAAEPLGVWVAGVTRTQLPRLLAQSPLLERFGAEAARALDALRQRERRRNRARDDRRLLEQQRLRAVVHEASNPLTIVRNYLHLLALKLGESVAGEELRVLREETERVGRILRRLAEADDVEPEEIGCNLNQTIRDLARVLDDALCRPRGIRLNLQLAEDVAPLARGCDALRQIILNLLRNAAEALGQGGAITVTTQDQINLQGRQYVEMAVADDGPGLSAELQAHLFQPLTSAKGGGHAGLGLAIVRTLVEELGGYVGYRPNTGGGAVFTLLLPQS